MIVFDLVCEQAHRFEAWFGSSGDFAEQRQNGLVCCPLCGSREVQKAPMAPALTRKGNQASGSSPQVACEPVEEVGEAASTSPVAGSPSDRRSRQLANTPLPKKVVAAMRKLAAAQEEALKDSRWVGKSFAEQSRAMHYGERDAEAIHGEASPDEARELFEEGIAVAPLPFPVVPPDEMN